MIFKKEKDNKIGCLNCGRLLPESYSLSDNISSWVCIMFTIYDYKNKSVYKYITTNEKDYSLGDIVAKLNMIHPVCDITFSISKNIHDSVLYEYDGSEKIFYSVEFNDEVEENIVESMRSENNEFQEYYESLDDLIDLEVSKFMSIDYSKDYRINGYFLINTMDDYTTMLLFSPDLSFIGACDNKRELFDYFTENHLFIEEFEVTTYNRYKKSIEIYKKGDE